MTYTRDDKSAKVKFNSHDIVFRKLTFFTTSIETCMAVCLKYVSLAIFVQNKTSKVLSH